VFEANAPRRSRLLPSVFVGGDDIRARIWAVTVSLENAEVGDFLAATRIYPGHSLPGAGCPSTSNRAATLLRQAQKRLGEGYAGGQMHPRVNALSSVAWQYRSAIRS
jgi:hypothetical protein